MSKRTDGKREDILIALRLAGRKGLTNADLSKIALRYGGYLGGLYKKGYTIEKEHLGGGTYNYVLTKEPEQEHEELPKAVDVLLEFVELHKNVTKEQLQELIDEIGISIRYKAGTYQKSA